MALIHQPSQTQLCSYRFRLLGLDSLLLIGFGSVAVVSFLVVVVACNNEKDSNSATNAIAMTYS